MIAVNWIVAIIVLIVSMLLIVLFKVTADNLKSGDGNAVSCLDEVT
jgi:ABC-type cobalt transport system substrate-binding protein